MIASLTSNRALIATIGVVLVFVLGSVLIPGFSSAFSVRAMLILAALLAIAALGQTLVMILGGIDLSIPFIIGFANVLFATLYGDGVPAIVAFVVVVAAAGGIGAISGALSAGLSIHPLIVTLGVGTVAQAPLLPSSTTSFRSAAPSAPCPSPGSSPSPLP
jgi:ribose transport system permease protein